jgi:hypothetical protein
MYTMPLLHVTVRFGNVMSKKAFLQGNPELFPGDISRTPYEWCWYEKSGLFQDELLD